MTDLTFPSTPEEYEEYQEALSSPDNGIIESDEYHFMMNQMADEAENSTRDPEPADFDR